ncbi:MAG TPA: hypothetical protein VHR40_12355 [Thermoleophilaceae bacterium]|nr:hypothetical protein [Thermoleophilaceae bacterium]
MSEQPPLPSVSDLLVSSTASLVNLAGIRLTDKDQKDPAQAKEAIDAARALLPLCPEEAVAPIKDALSQVQMLYVKETDERAKARSKIWTPGEP